MKVRLTRRVESTGRRLHQQIFQRLPGRRYYGGQDNTDQVEQLAIDRAKKLFGADHANVVHSGAQANGRCMRGASRAIPFWRWIWRTAAT